MSKIFEALNNIPGLSSDQAHELANKLDAPEGIATKSDIKDIRSGMKNMATKKDLTDQETRLTEKMGNQETRLTEKMGNQETRLTEKMATKKDLADQEIRLTGKIADIKHSTIKWVVGLGVSLSIGMSSLTVGLFFFLHDNLLEHMDNKIEIVLSQQSAAGMQHSEEKKEAAPLESKQSAAGAHHSEKDKAAAPLKFEQSAAGVQHSEEKKEAAPPESKQSVAEMTRLESHQSETGTAHLGPARCETEPTRSESKRSETEVAHLESVQCETGPMPGESERKQTKTAHGESEQGATKTAAHSVDERDFR